MSLSDETIESTGKDTPEISDSDDSGSINGADLPINSTVFAGGIESVGDLDAEALAKKAKEGDSLSFALLAYKYHRFLLKYVGSFDVPFSEREDLMQEGLIGLLKAVRSYDGSSSSFTTYSFHCIKTHIISALRRYSRQTKASMAEQIFDRNTSEMSISPETEFIDKESTKQLYDKFFSVLSSYESKVFELYLADVPIAEIALRTGKDGKSVENALQRIKAKLKKLV